MPCCLVQIPLFQYSLLVFLWYMRDTVARMVCLMVNQRSSLTSEINEVLNFPAKKVMNRNIPPKKRGKVSLKISMRANKKTNQSRAEIDKLDGSEILKRANGPSGRMLTLASHPCIECEKVFNSPGKLQQHMFVHTGERPFKCHECEKGFSSRFKLMRHALIHSNDRRYKCSYCERCFHRKDHLKNHLQVHNPNKKVYKCDQCEKEYNSRLSFRKHIAIHAAEAGDLECKVCSKLFDTSEDILYHLKVHTGSRAVKSPNEKKFKCEFCERRFFTRKDVKRHLVVHTGRRDFLCQYCPQRFGRKDHLVRHIKKSHNAPKIKELNEDGTPEYPSCDYMHFPQFEASTSTLLHSQVALSSPQSLSSPIHPPPPPTHHHHPPPPPPPPPPPASHHHQGEHHHPSHCHPHSQSLHNSHGCQQRHVDKDSKHFNTSLTTPTSYCSSSSTSSMYLLSSYATDAANDFKMYDDIKPEREELLPDQLSSSLDIGQLFGFLPFNTTANHSVPLTAPLTTMVTTGSPSTVETLTHSTLSHQHPICTTPLPQFNQAFQ